MPEWIIATIAILAIIPGWVVALFGFAVYLWRRHVKSKE